jgi:general secretion pathway protein G
MNRSMRIWITVGIVALLLASAVPTYQFVMLKSREAVLNTNLTSMREVIKQYTKDKNRAPQSLQDLVDAGYFRDTLPWDPFNAGWKPVIKAGGVTGVRSASNSISSKGTAYSTW